MKPLNRYETIGIAVSIVVIIGVLAASRFFPFSFPYRTVDTADTTPSDIITVDPHAKDQMTALRQALIDGSTGDDRITKLIVQDVRVGTGREARAGDTVAINYIATQKDGPEFDNTYKKNAPLSFKVGAGEVIKGLEEGIVGMKEGGKRILVVPSELGYGNTPVNTLPAHATLIFAIEIVSIE